MRFLSVLGASRPQYLEQTLRSLRACDGIEQWSCIVMLDECGEATDECHRIASLLGFGVERFPARLGCTAATIETLRLAWAEPSVEFVLHVEDDTPLCRDALTYFAEMAERYRDDADVFSVSAYQRRPFADHASTRSCYRRQWFTPWAWGTWRDRWLEMAGKFAAEPSWDWQVNHAMRGSRCEIAPTVSLSRNIGAVGGAHVPSAAWHKEHHHVTTTADDVKQAGDGWQEIAEPAWMPDGTWAMLGQRAPTFRQALDELAAKKQEGYVIVETGAMREPPGTDRSWSDGASTWLWDAFTDRFGGQVISCELEESRCVEAARHVSQRVTFLVGDSVRRLRELPAACADLLYLDSFDLDWTNPHPSALHHLQEIASGIHVLKPGGLLLIDDVGLTGGKGVYVITWLLRIGATCIGRGYQSLWRMP